MASWVSQPGGKTVLAGGIMANKTGRVVGLWDSEVFRESGF